MVAMNNTKDRLIDIQDAAVSPVIMGVTRTISDVSFNSISWPIAQAIDPICNSIYQTVDEALCEALSQQ